MDEAKKMKEFKLFMLFLLGVAICACAFFYKTIIYDAKACGVCGNSKGGCVQLPGNGIEESVDAPGVALVPIGLYTRNGDGNIVPFP